MFFKKGFYIRNETNLSAKATYKYWAYNDIIFDKVINDSTLVKQIDFHVDELVDTLEIFYNMGYNYNYFKTNPICSGYLKNISELQNKDQENEMLKEDLHKILHERKFKNKMNKLVEE